MKPNRILPLIALISTAVTAMLIFSIKSEEEIVQAGMILVKGEISDNNKMSPTSFLLDKHLVTVSAFNEFVKKTGYITDAETFGEAGVFDSEIQSFIMVKGANYRFPFGPNNPGAELNHPVTQVSWNDASNYARWLEKRLPTQLEWEFAAGKGHATSDEYAWGAALVTKGKHNANTWQGSFPFYNSVDDGFALTSPVGAFGENALGLTDMGGNVWQWCSDVVEPLPQEAIFDPGLRRALKGGSYLCDPMVCHGFKVKGNSSSTPESAMAHIGFRCAKDLEDQSADN